MKVGKSGNGRRGCARNFFPGCIIHTKILSFKTEPVFGRFTYNHYMTTRILAGVWKGRSASTSCYIEVWGRSESGKSVARGRSFTVQYSHFTLLFLAHIGFFCFFRFWLKQTGSCVKEDRPSTVWALRPALSVLPAARAVRAGPARGRVAERRALSGLLRRRRQ